MDIEDPAPAGPAGGAGKAAQAPAAPADRPAHAARPAGGLSRIAAGVGILAALTAVGLGTAALVHTPNPAPGAAHTLLPITVSSPPAAVLPLSEAEILGLPDRDPDFGPLTDPRRRASCLTGLGYSASTRVLGARPIEMAGHPAVLLVLPGEQAGTVVALAVPPSCSSADTGLLADTTIRRP